MAQRGFANLWGLNRVKELLTLCNKHVNKGEHSANQKLQRQSIIRKLCSFSLPVACASQVWDNLLQQVQAYFLAPSGALPVLQQACFAIEAVVEAEFEAREGQREASQQLWKRKQCKVGEQGGALHANIRRTTKNPDIITRCLGTRDASPQAIVAENFRVWNSLWSKLERFVETPWRNSSERGKGPPLPPLRQRGLRSAAASFKPRTASGVDALLAVAIHLALRCTAG